MDIQTEISLFTGYAGFTLGLRLAGINARTVCYVERESYCQSVLQAHIASGCLDDAPIWDDIRTFDGRPWRGTDLITAGFPCQPHSMAGKRSLDDNRNLWPDTLRVISEVEPRYVLLENVPGINVGDAGRTAYGGTVVGQLSELGYDAEWGTYSAADAGAPHRRRRWWLLAHLEHTQYDGFAVS